MVDGAGFDPKTVGVAVSLKSVQLTLMAILMMGVEFLRNEREEVVPRILKA
jgi:hypothetical protein